MRLIDADKLIEYIWKKHKEAEIYSENTEEVKDICCDIVSFIDEIPTAYDVTEKICEEIRICNAKLYDNSNTVNVLAICERRQALREVLRLIDKDVMV